MILSRSMVQGGSNMIGTNCDLFTQSVPVIFEPPSTWAGLREGCKEHSVSLTGGNFFYQLVDCQLITEGCVCWRCKMLQLPPFCTSVSSVTGFLKGPPPPQKKKKYAFYIALSCPFIFLPSSLSFHQRMIVTGEYSCKAPCYVFFCQSNVTNVTSYSSTPDGGSIFCEILRLVCHRVLMSFQSVDMERIRQ
jgi:hypothetical protein